MLGVPKVSVIIPAYNHSRYIEEALSSIANQTYLNVETIIIDDGSKDDTAEKVRVYIAQHPDCNMFLYTKQNEGVCRALNDGLSKASGEYVCFLASDDAYLPDKIATQVDFLERNSSVGMVFSDAQFIRFTNVSNEKWSDYKPGIQKYFINGVQCVDIYDVLITRAIIPALTVMTRRSVLLDVGWFDEKLVYEDDDMWLRIAQKYPIGYIDCPLALYRMHDSNVSNSALFMLRGMFGTVNKHFHMEPLSNKPIKRILLLAKLVFNIVYYRIKRRMGVQASAKG